MPDDAAFCPHCGRPMRPGVVGQGQRAQGNVGSLPENIAGALAYFLIPAIVFLVVEPYNRNRFVRFHSFQCLAVYVGAVIVGAALRIASFILFFIPWLGPLMIWLISLAASLAWIVLWFVLVVKAAQGEMFKLPIAGDFAEKQANAM